MSGWDEATPVVSERAYKRKISDEIEAVLANGRDPDERPSDEPPTAESVEEGIYRSCRIAESERVRALEARLDRALERAAAAEARATAAEVRERELARELEEVRRGIGGG